MCKGKLVDVWMLSVVESEVNSSLKGMKQRKQLRIVKYTHVYCY